MSTMPDFDAGSSPLARSASTSGAARETIDPDDFLGGFGVWSGTSFAAPIVAGRIAAALTGGAVSADEAVASVLGRISEEHASLRAKAVARVRRSR